HDRRRGVLGGAHHREALGPHQRVTPAGVGDLEVARNVHDRSGPQGMRRRPSMTGTTLPPTWMSVMRPPPVPTRMCRKLGRPMRVPCSLTMSTVAAGVTNLRSTREA